MVRKTTSLHDWMSDSAGDGLWRQPAGTRRITSTTYERASKRRDRRIIEDIARHADFHARISESERRETSKTEKLFNKIVDRVKKQHPEMRNIKARNYARTQDPIGRKFQRLKNQGYDVATISKKLGYNSKTGKFRASLGHSGG